MRITLDIDDDVLQAAKKLARRDRVTVGRVVSDLVRRGLEAVPASAPSPLEPASLFGLRPFTSRGGIVTNDIINQLRDDGAY